MYLHFFEKKFFKKNIFLGVKMVEKQEHFFDLLQLALNLISPRKRQNCTFFGATL